MQWSDLQLSIPSSLQTPHWANCDQQHDMLKKIEQRRFLRGGRCLFSVKAGFLTTISWFKEMAQLAQLSESSSVQIPFQNRWGYRGKSAPVNSKLWEYADLSTFRGASATWRFLTLRSIGEQPMLAVCWNPWIDGVGLSHPPKKRTRMPSSSSSYKLCLGISTYALVLKHGNLRTTV